VVDSGKWSRQVEFWEHSDEPGAGVTPEPPPAAGVRLDWLELPARVRAAVEDWLESTVVSATTQPGGFSPGVAARLRTTDGRRVFVKVVGPEPLPSAPRIHRREASIVAALPAEAPVPRLLWSYDEGDGGWVALVFEDIEGWNPAQPWRMDELDRVLDALVALSATLTPSPVPPATVGTVSEWGVARRGGWRQLRDERPALLDDWSARHLDALAELETEAATAVVGDTLLHLDVRSDNLLLTPDRVLVVDWPHARVGAAWVDLIFFAPSVAMQGGPPPEDLLERHPASRAAKAEAITAVVAAVAGFFTQEALQPAPPGLPTLRAFQAAQGVVARNWVAQRTGWT
jgi:aminoglycoside phosphotransferase (APT) family kinase protein